MSDRESPKSQEKHSVMYASDPTWIFHDALPDVHIRLIEVELRVGSGDPHWTRDVGTRLNVFKKGDPS